MFLYSFYIPQLTESEGHYIYFGEENPNDIITWTRTPNIGDEYIQLNDDMVNEIRWQLTDTEWIIISSIRFFIQALDGTTIYPDTTLNFKAVYDINGNIFDINENNYYFLKIENEDYSYTVDYTDLDGSKKVLHLYDTRTGNILDIIEITPMQGYLDLTPPDNTVAAKLTHMI